MLVTANYKMSFDRLRQALPGRDAWILVLDTRGINVWCAAGKGTFGTQELVQRVFSSGLAGVVAHRSLILPQLAGPSVAAHQVPKLSGFKVIYGPIRAEDLPVFIDRGFKHTLFFFLGGLGGPGGFLANALDYGLFAVFTLLGALAAGGVLTPLLLPWLPGRAFSLKGLFAGLIAAVILTAFRAGDLGAWPGRLEILAWFLLVPAVTAYLAMNFTGAST